MVKSIIGYMFWDNFDSLSFLESKNRVIETNRSQKP